LSWFDFQEEICRKATCELRTFPVFFKAQPLTFESKRVAMSIDGQRNGKLIQTGIAGLDHILLGGIMKGNIILLEGMPGTGKSTLALEFLYRGAQEMDEPGLFICLETSAEKLIRDAAGFGWDLPNLVRLNKLKIMSLSPTDLIDELSSDHGGLPQEITNSGLKRVVIDGLAPLRMLGDKTGARPFRETLHQLITKLSSLNITVMLTTELSAPYPIGESGTREEQYLADTVLTLRKQARRRSVHRSIEIAKSRGQDFFSGRHAMKIQEDLGLCVFPRVYARPKRGERQATSTERISSGNASLDSMVGGGLLKGSVTLIGGISGTGKTILGMQFLIDGAKAGEPCLLVSLDERPEQILRNADALGLELRLLHDVGHIFLHYDSPLEVDLDEHFYSIKGFVEKHNIQRVVIDSVAAYESTQPEEAREFCVSLAAYFKDRLITTIFSFESPELLGISQINDQMKSSAIADNIVLLNYIEISTLIRRAITVPKTRGSKPDHRTREYVIEIGGVKILDDKTVEGVERVPQLPLSSYYGVLARAPTRHSPLIDEHVAAGKPMPKSRVPSTSLKPKKDSVSKSRSKKGR